ncbi:hypothetical protein SSX86_005519 [Deinandra increscens subsp. villosa]|uniref:BHLH domain-containing protein n=1 Tax=Deinandra increscens subsp. villosa TaxID=3103831 RepID=A0AAP0DU45_9ASTR
MDERDGQEGLLRDIYFWATNNSSRGPFIENLSDEKPEGGEKLLNSSIDVDQLKKPDISIGGSGSGGQEAAPLASNGDLKIKREENQDSSDDDEKGIRDLQWSDHAKHLLTEKRRRKKMKDMFEELHDLLPKQTHKAKLITIVDDAINYIQNLQQTLQRLETQKLERLNRPSTNTTLTSFIHPQNHTAEPFSANGSSSTSHFNSVSCHDFGPFSLRFPKPVFQTWASSNVTLNVCGPDAHINIICSSNKPGLVTAVCVVLEKCKLDVVSLHVSSDRSKSMFMIHARVNEFMAAFSYEEIYKLAAVEMMHLVNPASS